MARKQLRDKKSDNMSVLGESYRLSALPGDTAVYPCRLHDASLFERLRYDQSYDYRRYVTTNGGNFRAKKRHCSANTIKIDN